VYQTSLGCSKVSEYKTVYIPASTLISSFLLYTVFSERKKMDDTMTNKNKTDALNKMDPNYKIGQKKKGGSVKKK